MFIPTGTVSTGKSLKIRNFCQRHALTKKCNADLDKSGNRLKLLYPIQYILNA